ncbi:uncharacterized protein LOC134805503 [Cydia splendana]|uniref:uncharacterized protein LOC134805503 n=1 Tax=Cydia splendana TaxID=1100963 RepID=UPI00300DA4B7
MATIEFLQGNLNHDAKAQDLFHQSMAQWSINIAIVAEPYKVPDRIDWAGDLDGTVAITTRSAAGSNPFKSVIKGHGCVAAVCGDLAVVGVYFSPNKTLAEFESFLVEVGALVGRLHPTPVIVAGDFNAKHAAWGSPVTDPRGRTLLEWAIAANLAVANKGTANTCVRQGGGSIVDITRLRTLPWHAVFRDGRYWWMSRPCQITVTSGSVSLHSLGSLSQDGMTRSKTAHAGYSKNSTEKP